MIRLLLLLFVQLSVVGLAAGGEAPTLATVRSVHLPYKGAVLEGGPLYKVFEETEKEFRARGLNVVDSKDEADAVAVVFPCGGSPGGTLVIAAGIASSGQGIGTVRTYELPGTRGGICLLVSVAEDVVQGLTGPLPARLFESGPAEPKKLVQKFLNPQRKPLKAWQKETKACFGFGTVTAAVRDWPK